MGCCKNDKQIELRYEKMDPNMPDLKFHYEDDACFDLMSVENATLYPNMFTPVVIHTGIKFNVPKGYEIQVRSRSGLAKNYSITVHNSPGTIDNYTGEVLILLFNHGEFLYKIKKYDCIAQAKLSEIHKFKFVKIDKVVESERGANGFGSTDKRI